MWLYSTADPRAGVRDAIELARSEGVELPVLWIDVETYTDGSIPGSLVIEAALDECWQLSVRSGIYSSRVMWSRIGNPMNLSGVPIWVADYNGQKDLSVTGFGGGEVFGHQFTSTPIDQNVFDQAVVE